jgi:hypothetical protein
MSLSCHVCHGDPVLPAYYANDAARTLRTSSKGCECIGGPSRRLGEFPRDGEREVIKAEFDQLKAFWMQPPVPVLQAAA